MLYIKRALDFVKANALLCFGILVLIVMLLFIYDSRQRDDDHPLPGYPGTDSIRSYPSPQERQSRQRWDSLMRIDPNKEDL